MTEPRFTTFDPIPQMLPDESAEAYLTRLVPWLQKHFEAENTVEGTQSILDNKGNEILGQNGITIYSADGVTKAIVPPDEGGIQIDTQDIVSSAVTKDKIEDGAVINRGSSVNQSVVDLTNGEDGTSTVWTTVASVDDITPEGGTIQVLCAFEGVVDTTNSGNTGTAIPYLVRRRNTLSNVTISQTDAATTTGGSLTLSYTSTTGTERAILVFVAARGAAPSSVTWGGQSLTSAVNKTQGSTYTAIFYGAEALYEQVHSGGSSNDIVVTAAGASGISVYAITLDSVDEVIITGLPDDTASAGAASGTAETVAVSNKHDASLVIGIIGSASTAYQPLDDTGTNANQVELDTITNNAPSMVSYEAGAGAGTTTLAWTFDSSVTDISTCAVAISPYFNENLLYQWDTVSSPGLDTPFENTPAREVFFDTPLPPTGVSLDYQLIIKLDNVDGAAGTPDEAYTYDVGLVVAEYLR